MDLGTTIDPKSSQLNADDLILGPMTIKITKVTGGETKEQPVKVFFEGDGGKPYLPCKTARRVMVQVWSRDGANYVGRSMTLYRDPDVKFGGIAVGGIRISHMSHLDKEMTLMLTASKTSRKPFTVKPLRNEPDTPTDPAVKAAGDKAASAGVESYKAWLASLTPEVKETVKWLHREWSRVAKAADEAESAEPTTEGEDGSVVERLREQIKAVVEDKGFFELSKKTRDELEKTPVDVCDDPARLEELFSLVSK